MIRVCFFCVVLAGLVGCRGGGSAPADHEEVASAHEMVKAGLEAWKDGKTPASLESGKNPVQFRDDDWRAGAKLLEYRIVKLGGEEEGEAVCTVHLKMEVRGKAVSRNVDYRVTLTPKRTVSRYPKKG
jgi:hypothetical protein